MTLQQIRYFLSIFVNGNLASASRDLFVTNSALSKSIKDFENEYGVRLFKRTKDGLIPTTTAIAIKDKATELVDAADELEIMLSKFVSRSDDYVYVGITPLTGLRILNSIYDDFISEYPDFHIIPVEASNFQTDAYIKSGQMDVTFVTYSENLSEKNVDLLSNPDFRYEPIGKTEFVFLAQKNGKYGNRKSVKVSDVCSEDFVFFRKPLQWEREINYRFKKIGRVPKVYTRVAYPPVLRTIVESGKAYSFQMRSVLGSSENISEIPLDPPAKYKIAMVWNPKSCERPAAKAFIDYCLERLK